MALPGSPRSDARTAASALALGRALRWYLDEVPSAKAPPLSEEQARALRAAFDGARVWQPEMFDWLMTFARSMYRLARLSPEAPECNVADALTALDTLPVRPGAAPWPVHTAVDPEVFAKLEFRAASEGIVTTQRENREGWWAHAQRNRSFIEEGAALPPRKELAVVLGAGQAFDLPLVPLCRAFSRLVLIDIDEQALAATVAGVFKDPALRARVEPRVVDLTGINRHLVGAIEAIVGGPGSADEVQAAVEDFCRSYRLAAVPALLPPGERADLLVSSCVASQVAWPQRTFALGLYEKRFRPVRDAAEQRWVQAWFELEMRIQQDHVNATAAAADVVVLTSDMVSHVTALDQAGGERPTGQKIYTMGVDSLRERIPRLCQVEQQATWEWPRYRAHARGAKGSRMNVDAALLREPPASGGLWVPES
jgi:hypothetical protein